MPAVFRGKCFVDFIWMSSLGNELSVSVRKFFSVRDEVKPEETHGCNYNALDDKEAICCTMAIRDKCNKTEQTMTAVR